MSERDKDEESRGFQVRDRRRFNEAGEARASEEPALPPMATASEPPPDESPADDADLPPINFSTFVMSLSTQALFCLGDLPDPDGAPAQTDLLAARELIDILGMLKDKTSGNLDPSESNLLEKILYDLRMRYVRRARS